MTCFSFRRLFGRSSISFTFLKDTFAKSLSHYSKSHFYFTSHPLTLAVALTFQNFLKFFSASPQPSKPLDLHYSSERNSQALPSSSQHIDQYCALKSLAYGPNIAPTRGLSRISHLCDSSMSQSIASSSSFRRSTPRLL
jgi:hypothetical protein